MISVMAPATSADIAACRVADSSYQPLRRYLLPISEHNVYSWIET
jgi:hypothetical protein